MKWFMSGVLGAFLMCNVAVAHEMVPTYPTWKYSAFEDVLKAEMEMFNKRQDVEYYEIGVFDADWNSVDFVSSYKLINLRYLQSVSFDIYIRKKDKDRAVYVCSKSKLRKDSKVRTAVSSKVCSKFK
jgi:hypothetical protein